MRPLVAAVALAALVGGCQAVLGIEERVLVEGAGGHGAGGGGGSGADGGPGVDGGACAPGAVEACYDGPAGTEGVGACKAGQRVCAEDGKAFGPCKGAVLPEIEDCATVGDDDCSGDAPACTGEVVVAKAEGGDGDDAALAVAVHLSGDAIVVGVEPGAPRGDLVAGRAFVERRAGKALDVGWMQAFSGGTSALLGVATGALGDLAVVGAIADATSYGGAALASKGGLDAVAMKLDPDTGAPVWATRFGDAAFDQVAEGVAVDRAGAVFVVGRFEGALDVVDPPLESVARSGFLAKLDPNGAAVWAVALPSTFLARSLRVAVGAGGDPVVSGTFAGAITIGARVHATTGLGDSDGFVAAFDGATGAARWSVALGDAHAQLVSALALGSGGEILVGGATEGAVVVGAASIPAAADGARHGFVLKLSAKGVFAWGARLGDSGEQAVRGVAVDPLGAVLVAGEAAGAVKLGDLDVATADGDPASALVAKLGPDGEARWLRLFGDTSAQRATAIATGLADARAVVVGTFAGTLTGAPDAAPLVSTSGADAFVLALAP